MCKKTTMTMTLATFDKNTIVQKLFRSFEEIKKEKNWIEYREARKLAPLLWYVDRRNFLRVIEKAKESCKNSWEPVNDHFVDVNKSIISGKGAESEISDMLLTRFACYLIAQNGDPKKEEIAFSQTYFALQTRKQELQDQYMEDSKRVHLREEMKSHNKKLMSTAKKAGVNDYANFNDAGYIGLYGIRVKQIQEVKWLNGKNLLDHIGSEELATNLFRTTQTESKIKREWIRGQEKASLTHFEVGKKVRKTIQEIGGTMSEKLPKAEHIKEAKKRVNIHKRLTFV